MSDPATDYASTEVDSGRSVEGFSAVPTDATDSLSQSELVNMNRAESKRMERFVDTSRDPSDQFAKMIILKDKNKVCFITSLVFFSV